MNPMLLAQQASKLGMNDSISLSSGSEMYETKPKHTK
jgi:hypothetical protein